MSAPATVRPCLDFHFHTYYSNDAFGDPAAYVALAAERGVAALAPAEHDNLDSLPAFAREIERQGAPVALYSGVEIDTDCERWGHCHVLAFFFDPMHAGLRALLRREVDAGLARLGEIAARMRAAGMEADLDAAFAHARREAPERTVGPKALWLWLHETGRAPSFEAAKALYHEHARAIPATHRCADFELTLRTVHEAGGIALLAHPQLTRFAESDVAAMMRQGLDGVEVYHTGSGTEGIEKWERLARWHGWPMSGGSDNHLAVDASWTGWPTAAPATLLEGLFQAAERRHAREPRALTASHATSGSR
ncbi:MAG: PHP domain-containing protein [Planctomycetota bacterium]|nr:PHP domain-containing protein [Planctomycetota bacterium]